MRKLSKIFTIAIAFVLGLFLISSLNVKAAPVTVEAKFIDHGTNVPAGDITSMFGLDENIFAIHQVNNEAGTNMWMTATELRLYSVRATGEGTELVFEVAEGYKILSIEFTVLKTYNPHAEVFVDSVSHNVYSDYGTKILVGELSATTVSIKNVHEGGDKNIQLRIGGIKITYQSAQEPLIESVKGASIRTDGVQGLRFYAKVLKDKDIKEKGFYLLFGQATIDDLQAALTEPKVGEYHQHNEKDVVKTVVEGLTVDNEFSVVLTGIPEQGYLDGLTVIPYVIAKGETEASFIEPVTRSVGEVAIKMAQEVVELPEGVQDVLNSIEANVVRVGFVGENLEVAKGMKDVNGEYVDPDLYTIYQTSEEYITLPTPEDKTGFTFVDWYDNDSYTGSPVTSITIAEVNERVLLYAKWDEEEPSVLEATMEFGDAKFTLSNTSQNGEKTIDGLGVTVTSSNAYWDGKENNSLRLGSGKSEGSITLTFSATVKITKVTVYASQYDGAVSVKVNDLTAKKVTNATGSDYIGYEFIVDSLNAFTVSSVKTSKSRIQIQKIVIEYELK